MFTESEIKKSASYKKSIFQGSTIFKGYVKIVKKYMVSFNVTTFNRLKIMRFI